jgi:hypothetical protein
MMIIVAIPFITFHCYMVVVDLRKKVVPLYFVACIFAICMTIYR